MTTQEALNNIDELIEFANSIEDDQWYIGKFRNDDNTKHCFIGHLIKHDNTILNNKFDIVNKYLGSKAVGFAAVNDGKFPEYQQPTPKLRVLAALNDYKQTVSELE